MTSSSNGSRKYRNYPKHTLAEALPVAQKIQDEMGGKPFKRLLLADALGIKPGSSTFNALLSSSYRYGLTDGTEKAPEIMLTPIGANATQVGDPAKRRAALKEAALRPPPFNAFYTDYADKKVPSAEMIGKILTSEYGVPAAHTEECATIIDANGRLAEIIRDIGGSPHVLLDGAASASEAVEDLEEEPDDQTLDVKGEEDAPSPPARLAADQRPHPIFIGHGKKTAPLEKLQKFLTKFQIPYKVAAQEANLGRPIPDKVKDIMEQCGSAILIFTRDELFYDKEGNEVWRPSENVINELGAASYAYEDKVVIFKETGISFPTNFQSIGHIAFEEDSIDAKTAELLQELIGFGLVKITTAA